MEQEPELRASELLDAIRDVARDGWRKADPASIEVINRFKRHALDPKCSQHLIFYYP